MIASKTGYRAGLGVAAAFFLCAYSSSAAAVKCPSAHPAIEAEAGHGSIGEVADVTLAQLARVSREQAQQLRHPLLGVYTRTIAIILNIEDTVAEVGDSLRCTVPVVVHVRVTLSARVIHLPRDFGNNPCLLDLSRSHQRKHTDADDALLDRLVATYSEDLPNQFAALNFEPAQSEDGARLRMTEVARAVVQQQLDRYEYHQAPRAAAAVDTPEEVARIRDACGGALKAGEPL